MFWLSRLIAQLCCLFFLLLSFFLSFFLPLLLLRFVSCQEVKEEEWEVWVRSYGSGFTHTNSTQLNSTEPSFRFVSFLFVLRSDTDTDTTRRNQTKEEEEEGRMRRDIGSPLSSRVEGGNTTTGEIRYSHELTQHKSAKGKSIKTNKQLFRRRCVFSDCT